MKVRVIGISGTGGNAEDYSKLNIKSDVELTANINCNGEITDSTGANEENLKDLIIRWDYAIMRGIGLVYNFYKVQHFRVEEIENEIEDKSLNTAIELSYKKFKEEFNSRNTHGGLLPMEDLTPELTGLIADRLKLLF